MADFFDGEGNNERRSEGQPGIILADLRRGRGPILLEGEYRVFAGTTFLGWFLLVFIVWVFRIEVTLTDELMTAMAGSSVELAGLSLAVLGLLHQLNREDRWFKLGLLLVATLFAAAVLGGFWLVMTWEDGFNDPQQITVILVAALGVVAFVQVDWLVVMERLAMGRPVGAGLERVLLWLRSRGMVLPFVLPLVFLWLPGLNRLTGMVVLFGGALLALLVLMGVTTVMMIRRGWEREEQNPVLFALEVQARRELEMQVRLEALRGLIMVVLDELQQEYGERAAAQGETPKMVSDSDMVSRLRSRGVAQPYDVIQRAVTGMVNEGQLYRLGYADPLWLVPDAVAVESCANGLNEFALIQTEVEIGSRAARCVVEGYLLEDLRNQLAEKGVLPKEVVAEFVMPVVWQRLRDPDRFARFDHSRATLFVRREWVLTAEQREELCAKMGGKSFPFDLREREQVHQAMSAKQWAVLAEKIQENPGVDIQPEIDRIMEEGRELNRPLTEEKVAWSGAFLGIVGTIPSTKDADYFKAYPFSLSENEADDVYSILLMWGEADKAKGENWPCQ